MKHLDVLAFWPSTIRVECMPGGFVKLYDAGRRKEIANYVRYYENEIYAELQEKNAPLGVSRKMADMEAMTA